MSLDLADLVDLELQLKRDASRPRADLARRDDEIRATLPNPDAGRPALLRQWLDACREREQEGALVGATVASGYKAANVVLAAVALLVGWGTGAGLFRFTGDHPINVLTVLGVLVFAQLFILALTLASVAVLGARPDALSGLPFAGALRNGVRRLAYRIARVGSKGEEREAQLRRAAAFVAGRRSLYYAVERALVFRALQLASVAFNVGALSCLLTLVVFSDLAFGWSTTLDLVGADVERLCSWLAVPWSWIAPDAVPGAELIDATRYSRLEDAYLAPGATADGAGAWWKFLAMSMAVYGLLPRATLLWLGSRAIRRAIARAPLDTPDVDALVRRLTTRRIARSRGDDPADLRPLGGDAEPVDKPAPVAPGQPVLCARWRDATFASDDLDDVLRDVFSAARADELGAAGGYDYDDDERFAQRVADDVENRPVFIIAEPWASPDRAFARFVAELRRRGGPRRHINVLLTAGGSPAHTDIWRGYLAELADPYLSLDPETAVPAQAVAS